MNQKNFNTIAMISVWAACGSVAQAEFIFQDPMQSDSGWVGVHSNVDFGKFGMSATGVAFRDVEEFPEVFDARITIDASKSLLWAFGVAGNYDEKTGFSGIAIVADNQDKPGFTLGRWDQDSLIDSVWVDAAGMNLFEGIHKIGISARDGHAWADIDGATHAKLSFDSKPKGSQVVVASFSDGDTYFRDFRFARVPAIGTLSAFAPFAAFLATRRRRNLF